MFMLKKNKQKQNLPTNQPTNQTFFFHLPSQVKKKQDYNKHRVWFQMLLPSTIFPQ